MRLIRIFLTVGVASLGLAACGSDDGSDTGRTVVATTPVVADFAGQVAGDRFDVKRLLAPNADPHEYEPRPSDAAAVADADLVLRSGGDLDEWVGELIDSSGSDADVVTLIDSVTPIEGTGEDEGDLDPHWWHDPANALAAVRAIRDALTKADPGGREDYARNAAAYEKELRSLDADIRKCMDDIPAAQRKLVTTHDALGYFAKRYGVEVIGTVIPSLSTEGQPSAGDTAKLIDQIKEEDVKVVFAESSVNSKVEDAIARDAGARVGGKLWADTLGPPGSSGETYLMALAANADELARGFTDGKSSCGLSS
jgi:ABC-type Zn uptake system ZnuABC Zn-binding protein ZnuA